MLKYWLHIVAIIWRRSTDKHGIVHEDPVHAILFSFARVDKFDEPRLLGHNALTLFLGPGRERDVILEVMVEILDSGDVSVFHVMEARQKIVTLVEEMRNR